MFKHIQKALVPATAVALILGLSGCGAEAIPGADSFVCVYDRDEKLQKQLPPNSPRERIDEEGTMASIPTSNRFWKATTDGSKDFGAPDHYSEVFAENNTGMLVEGTLRFVFFQENACEWFAQHGRRNLGGQETLGFNARSEAEKAKAGWFTILKEEFTPQIHKAIYEAMPGYTWQQLKYDYPMNANPTTGELPAGVKAGEKAHAKFKREVSERVTELLNESLGGQYFCGISGKGECPPLMFDLAKATPQNAELAASAEALTVLEAKAELATKEAKLQENNLAAQIKAEKANQALLEERLKTARIEAEIKNAACLPLAREGLACDGTRPAVTVR